MTPQSRWSTGLCLLQRLQIDLQRSDSKAILHASCGNTASMQLPCTCQSTWSCAWSTLFIQAFQTACFRLQADGKMPQPGFRPVRLSGMLCMFPDCAAPAHCTEVSLLAGPADSTTMLCRYLQAAAALTSSYHQCSATCWPNKHCTHAVQVPAGSSCPRPLS